jgi:hypothetical protein
MYVQIFQYKESHLGEISVGRYKNGNELTAGRFMIE